MSKTLLDRIKSGEVTQVVSDKFGISETIYIQNDCTYPIHVCFPDDEYKDFTSIGQYFVSGPDISDIYPYNAPESVQEFNVQVGDVGMDKTYVQEITLEPNEKLTEQDIYRLGIAVHNFGANVNSKYGYDLQLVLEKLKKIVQPEPQPTIEEFAEWVTTDEKAKIAILSGIDGTELIELFKHREK